MIDWAKLLLDLRSHGLRAPAVARHVGVGERTIYALIEGRITEPKHSVGEKIKDLHGRLCRDTDTHSQLGQVVPARQR